MSELLEVEGVGFRYGSRSVLREVSFAAGRGEFVAIVGVNGAGKSTLLDLISGFKEIACGHVSIEGKLQREWTQRELAKRMSHLPQTTETGLPFSAGQMVAMGRYPHTDQWFESEEDHRLVHAAMVRTHSWEYRDRRFASLSGGERQRVLLAACLAQDASILLLDEPSTFLDIEAQLHCFTLLRDEAATGRLCLAVTHDLNLALTYCTRLLVLAEGMVAKDISTAAVGGDHEWLGMFSPRLRLTETPGGAPWIWYE